MTRICLGWDYWDNQILLRKFMLKYFNLVHYDYCNEWSNIDENCDDGNKHESFPE